MESLRSSVVHWARQEMVKQDLSLSMQQTAGLSSTLAEPAPAPAPTVLDTGRSLPKLAARLDLHQDHLQELQVRAGTLMLSADVGYAYISVMLLSSSTRMSCSEALQGVPIVVMPADGLILISNAVSGLDIMPYNMCSILGIISWPPPA